MDGNPRIQRKKCEAPILVDAVNRERLRRAHTLVPGSRDALRARSPGNPYSGGQKRAQRTDGNPKSSATTCEAPNLTEAVNKVRLRRTHTLVPGSRDALRARGPGNPYSGRMQRAKRTECDPESSATTREAPNSTEAVNKERLRRAHTLVPGSRDALRARGPGNPTSAPHSAASRLPSVKVGPADSAPVRGWPGSGGRAFAFSRSIPAPSATRRP